MAELDLFDDPDKILEEEKRMREEQEKMALDTLLQKLADAYTIPTENGKPRYPSHPNVPAFQLLVNFNASVKDAEKIDLEDCLFKLGEKIGKNIEKSKEERKQRFLPQEKFVGKKTPREPWWVRD